jgi:hypothetical protein
MIPRDVEKELADANSMITQLIKELAWVNTVFGTMSLITSDSPRDIQDTIKSAEVGYNRTKVAIESAGRLTRAMYNSKQSAVGTSVDVEPIAEVGTGLTVDPSTNTLTVAGGADNLTTATGVVSVAAATAPTTGQVLTATSGTAATWQTPVAPKVDNGGT